MDADEPSLAPQWLKGGGSLGAGGALHASSSSSGTALNLGSAPAQDFRPQRPRDAPAPQQSKLATSSSPAELTSPRRPPGDRDPAPIPLNTNPRRSNGDWGRPQKPTPPHAPGHGPSHSFGTFERPAPHQHAPHGRGGGGGGRGPSYAGPRPHKGPHDGSFRQMPPVNRTQSLPAGHHAPPGYSPRAGAARSAAHDQNGFGHSRSDGGGPRLDPHLLGPRQSGPASASDDWFHGGEGGSRSAPNPFNRPSSVLAKVAFEKDYPSLDKSPSPLSPLHPLSKHASWQPSLRAGGQQQWTSRLAEVPAAPAPQLPASSALWTHESVAAAVAAPPPPPTAAAAPDKPARMADAIQQMPVPTSVVSEKARLEQLELRQSKQLIPMVPGAARDKSKSLAPGPTPLVKLQQEAGLGRTRSFPPRKATDAAAPPNPTANPSGPTALGPPARLLERPAPPTINSTLSTATAAAAVAITDPDTVGVPAAANGGVPEEKEVRARERNSFFQSLRKKTSLERNGSPKGAAADDSSSRSATASPALTSPTAEEHPPVSSADGVAEAGGEELAAAAVVNGVAAHEPDVPSLPASEQLPIMPQPPSSLPAQAEPSSEPPPIQPQPHHTIDQAAAADTDSPTSETGAEAASTGAPAVVPATPIPTSQAPAVGELSNPPSKVIKLSAAQAALDARLKSAAEEEAFLRSLGWTGDEEEEEGGLTEEEIAAFRTNAQALRGLALAPLHPQSFVPKPASRPLPVLQALRRGAAPSAIIGKKALVVGSYGSQVSSLSDSDSD